MASRRRAEELIRAGRVEVNGQVAKLGDRADPENDAVTLDGRSLLAEDHVYWLVNKPRGVLSTVRDPEGRPTVLDLVPKPRPRLFPVGRLDLDSEGLVLLTNDGELAQRLLHPSFESPRVYRVTVRGKLDGQSAKQLARGVELEDGRTAPARVGPRRYDARSETTRLTLTLIEGRKRQIRRSLEKLGYPVTRLLRVQMGPLELGRLAAGKSRVLRAAELRQLRAYVREREANSRR